LYKRGSVSLSRESSDTVGNSGIPRERQGPRIRLPVADREVDFGDGRGGLRNDERGGCKFVDLRRKVLAECGELKIIGGDPEREGSDPRAG
jgi:hypothetical protein